MAEQVPVQDWVGDWGLCPSAKHWINTTRACAECAQEPLPDLALERVVLQETRDKRQEEPVGGGNGSYRKRLRREYEERKKNREVIETEELHDVGRSERAGAQLVPDFAAAHAPCVSPDEFPLTMAALTELLDTMTEIDVHLTLPDDLAPATVDVAREVEKVLTVYRRETGKARGPISAGLIAGRLRNATRMTANRHLRLLVECGALAWVGEMPQKLRNGEPVFPRGTFVYEAPEAAPGPPERRGRALEKWAHSAAQVGNRNDTGMRLVRGLKDLGYSEAEAARAMRAYARSVPQTGDRPRYTVQEAMATLRSAYRVR